MKLGIKIPTSTGITDPKKIKAKKTATKEDKYQIKECQRHEIIKNIALKAI